MIFAAGLGTRLGELTRDLPKALVSVGGVPLLERVARRLVDAGADRLIINVHHHLQRVIDFVTSRGGFGVQVEFSVEEEQPLETGGGLLHAAHLFRTDAPFFIHNVDILTDTPLRAMYQHHLRSSAIVTLGVMNRPSSRRLMFDERGLYGRVDERRGIVVEARPPRGEVRQYAFSGIHVASPELLGLISEDGVFSILDPYLRLAGEGYAIKPYTVDGYRWFDVGKPEELRLAEESWKDRGEG